MTRTTVQSIFETYGECWSYVTYDENGFNFHERDPSDRRQGVYSFVSQYGIEKVGKIENAKGIAARSYQYETSRSRVLNGKYADASDRLWEETMMGELKGAPLRFYFIPTETVMEERHGVTIEISYTRSLEKELSLMARAEGQPMRLAGKGN